MRAAGSDCDVLVVGGGPVGMLVAGDLAALGISTVVVERHVEPVDQPRAGTMHARTVQSLLRRGLVEDGKANGSSAPYPYAGMPGLVISVPSREGEAVLNVPQLELERRFERRAVAQGARVSRETSVTAISDLGDMVVAEVEGRGGAREIRARFAVGADGARSIVRQAGGFRDEIFAPTLAAIIAKVRLRDHAALPQGWRMFDAGWTRVEPRADGAARVMTFDFAGPHADRRVQVTEAELSAEFERICGVPLHADSVSFLARFSDYARLATQYRRGRLLLAGDAAHVHFPIGGQGLNLGIQEAFNLAWKLAATIRGADPALLDSYHEERHPVAARVIDSTRAQVVLMRPGSEYEPLRNVMRSLMAEPGAGAVLADRISGQGIAYGRTGGFQSNLPVTASGRPGTLAGLLTAVSPVLMLRGRPDIAALARPWRGHIVEAEAGDAAAVGWDAALVRPDGYLAWTSTDGGEALAVLLESWFGPAGSHGAT